MDVLNSFLGSSAVIALQETHGTLEELLLLLGNIGNSFMIGFAPGADRATAGVATLISHEFVGKGTSDSEIILPGRVLRSSVSANGRETIIYNIHNYGLSAGQVVFATVRIKRDIERARLAPSTVSVWLMGDFNFLCQGNLPICTSSPPVNDASDRALALLPANQHSQYSHWTKVLDELIELEQSEPTHYLSMNGTMSKLDRIYTSLASWALASAAMSSDVCISPERLHGKKISDHAPVRFTISIGRPLPPDLRPIPQEIFLDPAFKRYHEKLCIEANLEMLPPIPRWQQHKMIIRLAAKYAREEMFLNTNDMSSLSTSLPPRCPEPYGGMTRGLRELFYGDARLLRGSFRLKMAV